jgi:sugar/nucleoside kinase (ribokinase family)
MAGKMRVPRKKNLAKKIFDLVAIGDCALDTFLKVDEATVTFDKGGEHPMLCFPFGDKIPYSELYQLSAGNANNVAVGASRLGFKSALYATVGGDHNSHVILNALRADSVSEDLMSIQKKALTNFHVVLWHGDERTILIRHQDFAYRLPAGTESAKWIYLTSVGKKGLSLHAPVAAVLRARPNMKMGFNPGTFQLRLGLAKLMPLMRRTEILFVNKDEAEMLVGRSEEVLKLANALHEAGPVTVVITDGLKGSYCLHDGELYYISIYPHKPIEATGAGDAFATGFMAARMHGLPVTEALRWGARNGASVATKVGPQAGLVPLRQMQRDLKAHGSFRAVMLSKLQS